MNVWRTLSAIDVNAYTEKKGQFTYLAWTWAWATVKQHYPSASYKLLEDQVFGDGTMEVRCEVTIDDMTLSMWLPVTNHQNKAIPNPNAFDINTARMRCLVKCIAMFGLGHYIYAGESVPTNYTLIDVAAYVKECISKNDEHGLNEAWDELTEEEVKDLWTAVSKGGYFNQEEKRFIQNARNGHQKEQAA